MSDVLDLRQPGRINQRRRTHEAILDAASTLLRRGATPSVVEAAAAARVSQATAYRYFPTQDSLLAAVVEREMRAAVHALERRIELTGEPEHDVLRLAEAIFEQISLREPEHRSLLRLALDRWFGARRGDPADIEIERGGRIAFIMEALEPLRPRLGDAGLFRLAEALSLAIGIEAQLVLRDVWRLPKSNTAEVIRWTCRALVRQALADAGRRSQAPGPPAPAAKRALERSRRRRREARA